MHPRGMNRIRDMLLAGATAMLGAQGASAADGDERVRERTAMVEEQLASRDITDRRVLAAMRKVPRHRFVPESERRYAYRDTPLPIGEGQTISQPYIVALMTQLVRPSADDRVLEVGTGSGYQAAVLAGLVGHVYSVELEPALATQAEQILHELGIDNVTVRAGDGYAGWPEHAPFDIIVITAAPDHVPQPLLDQLKEGGRMIVPVGPVHATQRLQLYEKDSKGEIRKRDIAAVRFVPLRRAP
jgi:protein-L-isoaspartate(D-aspartate) O-methyltransferase